MHSFAVRLIATLPIPFALAAGPLTHAEPPEIRWRPDRPLQGSLVLFVVRPAGSDTTVPVTGTLAGETLHFESDQYGAFVAMGGIPLDAADSILLQVSVNGAQTVTLIPLARRPIAREVLRAAPRFSRPPDSTLAARVERERLRVREVVERARETPRLWTAPFVLPRRSQIRSGFGFEREFSNTVTSRHLGVDFAGKQGAAAQAANRGVVALVDDLFYGGRTIYVDHGAGLLTAYMHLSRALVAAGDTVQRGQVIGRVGATGRVTGPHLHWAARYGAILVDPLDLVNLDWTPFPSGPKP